MITEAQAQQLHDRYTRGLALTHHEQAALEAWYAEQDRQESEVLAGAYASNRTGELEAQLNLALSELRSVTEHIQQVVDENNRVRSEIAMLQRELSAARVAPA